MLFEEMLQNTVPRFLATTLIIQTQSKEIYKKLVSVLSLSNCSFKIWNIFLNFIL